MAESRNIAQTLIKSGMIEVDGTVVIKPSAKVEDDVRLTSRSGHNYVGRAALKLKGFLEAFDMSVQGCAVLDIGASTGGFTEILLEQGAVHVTAVDVGRDQLHERIKADPRVRSVEEQDIRSFASEPFEIVTCDVSFISIHHILEAIDRLAKGIIIILFKPQFEVGAQVKRNRAGVVTDTQAIETAKAAFETAAEKMGWQLQYSAVSTLEGKEGNREQFYCFRKN